MKYFITGGEGFIGFHLCNELLKDEGNTIVTYDANKYFISLEKSQWLTNQAYRIRALADHKDRITRIRGDVTDRSLLRDSLEANKPDVIVHLAALPIAIVSNDHPQEAKTNVFDTTATLLEVLKEASFKFNRLVYTSSSMVYGNFRQDEQGNILPALEDQACHPIGLYEVMKLSGEYLVKAYAARFGLPYTIIRPSAVYGPTESNHRVTETYVLNALQGKPLELDNGGLQQVDFTYVKDAAKGFALASTSPNVHNQTLNITRGQGRTIKELAEIVASLVPGTEIVNKEAKIFRPNRGALDISRARRLLGFQPEYSLERGMEEYVAFVKDTLEGRL